MGDTDRSLPAPLAGMPGGHAVPAPVPGGPAAGQPGTAQPTTTAGSGSYSVDIERVPQAIADLRRAADALEAEIDKARELARITPPGLDVVSANAVRVFAEVAAGEQGSLRLALEGAVRRFRADADKLEASLKTYLQVDEISLPPARELDLGVPQ